jgi:hypothetical protein
VQLVREATEGGPMGSIGPIKEMLGDMVSYEDLHVIRAYLGRR